MRWFETFFSFLNKRWILMKIKKSRSSRIINTSRFVWRFPYINCISTIFSIFENSSIYRNYFTIISFSKLLNLFSKESMILKTSWVENSNDWNERKNWHSQIWKRTNDEFSKQMIMSQLMRSRYALLNFSFWRFESNNMNSSSWMSLSDIKVIQVHSILFSIVLISWLTQMSRWRTKYWILRFATFFLVKWFLICLQLSFDWWDVTLKYRNKYEREKQRVRVEMRLRCRLFVMSCEIDLQWLRANSSIIRLIWIKVNERKWTKSDEN